MNDENKRPTAPRDNASQRTVPQKAEYVPQDLAGDRRSAPQTAQNTQYTTRDNASQRTVPKKAENVPQDQAGDRRSAPQTAQNAQYTTRDNASQRTVPQTAQNAGGELPRRQSSGIPQRERSVTDAASGAAQTNVGESTTRVIPVRRAPAVTDEPTVSASAQNKKKKKKKDHTASEVLREEGSNAVISLVKAAIYLVVVLVASALISMAVILIGNDMFAFVKESREVQIVVPVGTDLDGLKDILAEAGLVKYPRIFKLYADHKTKDNQNFATLEFVPEDYELPEGKSAVFIAGTYDLNTDMDYEDLLWSFLPPEKSGTSWVTIPEGYTTDDIINLLVEKGIGERDNYVEVINTYDFSSFWFVEELETSGKWSVDEYKRTGKVSSGRIYRLDGYLFPDTYEFYNASREATVIKKMLYRFSQIYNSEYRDMAQAQGFSTDELITLSSMIEKEAGRPNDFFSVSEVFRNRLDAPEYFPYLQSDATVLYQISHEKGERPKHVTHEDTLLDVPYNTYAYTGLPPGPISNPSATAILAALNPSKNGYYYFVSGTERTYFSTNQWDHNYWVGVASAEWANAGEN